MLAFNLGGQHLHILLDLLVGDSRVELSGLDVRVAEHLGHRLDRDSVFKSDGGCKSVAGTVEGDVLVDVADGDDLLTGQPADFKERVEAFYTKYGKLPLKFVLLLKTLRLQKRSRLMEKTKNRIIIENTPNKVFDFVVKVQKEKEGNTFLRKKSTHFFVSITAQVLLTSHLMARQCHFTPIIATNGPVIGTSYAPLKYILILKDIFPAQSQEFEFVEVTTGRGLDFLRGLGMSIAP